MWKVGQRSHLAKFTTFARVAGMNAGGWSRPGRRAAEFGENRMMDNQKCIERLEKKGVRATSIRILVLQALMSSQRAMSLSELETELDTVDKSSIFRSLEAFEKHHVVHSIDDGTGSVKYEVCEGEEECTVSDMHTHFYCEKCHKTFCLKDITVPVVPLPEGFETASINYIIKGTCPSCRRKS